MRTPGDPRSGSKVWMGRSANPRVNQCKSPKSCRLRVRMPRADEKESPPKFGAVASHRRAILNYLGFGPRAEFAENVQDPAVERGTNYCNFAYSALARFNTGVSVSASFHSERNS